MIILLHERQIDDTASLCRKETIKIHYPVWGWASFLKLSLQIKRYQNSEMNFLSYNFFLKFIIKNN